MNLRKRIIVISCALLFVLGFLPSLYGNTVSPILEAEEKDKKIFRSLEDFQGTRIAIETGTIFNQLIADKIPDAEVLYYNSPVDSLNAVKNNLSDACALEYNMAIPMLKDSPELTIFETPLNHFTYAYAFPKTEKGKSLQGKMNAYLQNLESTGTLNSLRKKWGRVSKDQKPDVFDFPSLPAINGTLHYATDGISFPYDYFYEDQLTGIEAEILYNFAKKEGYAVEINVMSFSGLLPALQGKCDLAGSAITPTEERAENVYFSSATWEGKGILVIREEQSSMGSAEFTARSQITKDQKLGVISSAAFISIAEDDPYLSNAELMVYSSVVDSLTALKEGLVDCAMIDSPAARLFSNAYPELTYIRDPISTTTIGIGFAKGNPLREKIGEVIQKLIEDGVLKELEDKWLDAEDGKTVPKETWPGKNGTLTCCVDVSGMPFAYAGQNGEVVGLETELLLRVAEILDYHLEILITDADGRSIALQTGKADLCYGLMTVTEERKESIDFIEYYDEDLLLMVRSTDPMNKPSKNFFEQIAESFEKTFVRENRYLLFIGGVGTTLLITLCSLVLGTALGFLLFLLYRRNVRFINVILNWISDFVTMTPLVVILMILYYIVFAKSKMGGNVISIITFSISFSVSVLGILKMGVTAVDSGQREAGLALGFSEQRTFLRIIFPQAANYAMPAYRSAVVDLIKATAVVGYVAVQDMTKVSDIVRSRTYEPFSPLIVVAILYFLLAKLLVLIVNIVAKKIDSSKRNPEMVRKEIES